jgi:hypothetical protein
MSPATVYQKKRIIRLELIEHLDTPCNDCGGKEDRELHRLIHGKDGGQYIFSNVIVLCHTCHVRRHYQGKFKVGDRVRFSGRVCRWATYGVRKRTRRIVAVSYDSKKQCNYYQLGGRGGDNSWSPNGYWFRSYELSLANELANVIGRPLKVLSAVQNEQIVSCTALAILPDLETPDYHSGKSPALTGKEVQYV